MGFGILLFGYFLTFAFSISNYYFFADIIGALIMLYAFSKLWQYNLHFKSAAWATFVFIAICAVNASSLVMHTYDSDSLITFVIGILKLVLAFVVHIFVFLGIRGLSLGAGDGKLKMKAERQLVMTTIYYTFALLLIAFSSLLGSLSAYLNFAVFVYWIVCFIMNMILLYFSFGKLYPADEDEDAVPRSKIGIFNKINDKFDSFEENSNKFRRESMEMARAEAERIAEEKKKKIHHSKKKKK